MTTDHTARRRPRFYYGWVIVVVVALVSFVQTAETLPVQSVFLKPLTEDFGWSRTVFTGSMTIGTVLGGIIAIIMGPLIDRFGGRRILVIALPILGVSVILLAFITTLWQFYTLQILGRMVTMGVIALATSVIIPKWFVSRRGLAVAMGFLGLRAGNTITPLYAQLLVSIWNWRVAIATTGAVVLAVSILPVAVFLRRRPEDMGLQPDGGTPADIDRHHAAPSGTFTRSSRKEVSLSLRQVVRLPSFYLLVIAFSLGYLIFPSLNLHMIPYLTDRGLGPGIAVGVLAVWSASGALGSIIFGLLADRYGTRRIITVDFLLVAAGLVLLLAVRSPTLGLLWGLYQGLAQGGVLTLQQVMLADYYGRESIGAIRGVVWPVNMMANAAGPMAAALAYDITGSYLSIFALFVAFALLASLCVFVARPPAHSAPQDVKTR